MSDILLWIILIELTLAIAVGGFVLYEIQTALAVIVLHECGDVEDPAAVEPSTLTPEILEAEAPRMETNDRDPDTIGTFTGAAWR